MNGILPVQSFGYYSYSSDLFLLVIELPLTTSMFASDVEFKFTATTCTSEKTTKEIWRDTSYFNLQVIEATHISDDP